MLLIERDIPPLQSMHDFDILLPEVEAMEVTTATKQELRSLYAALDKNGLDLVPAKGKRSWQVTLNTSASVKEIQRNREFIATDLHLLEMQGHSDLIIQRDRHHDPLVASFAENYPGIKDVFSFGPASRGPMIVLMIPGAASVIGAELIPTFIANFLSDPLRADVASKLRNAGSKKAHAFVWVERTEFGAFESLCEGTLPQASPFLPEGITDVWIAAKCRNGGTEVWHVNPPFAWQRVQSADPATS